jgi:tetratricopeptide (TPR) repeat protein
VLRCGATQQSVNNVNDNLTSPEMPPADPKAQSDEVKRVTRLAYGITAILMTVFIVGVALYAIYGEGVVTALTEKNGEVLLTQARTAVKAGNEDEAVQLYAKAVQGSFSGLDLKIWAMEEFVRYLLGLDLPEEAVPVMIRAAELDPSRASAYDLLVQVFMQAQDYERALQAADLWIERLQETEAPSDLDRARRTRDKIMEKINPHERTR